MYLENAVDLLNKVVKNSVFPHLIDCYQSVLQYTYK